MEIPECVRVKPLTRKKIAFVFSGLGSQWKSMGKALEQEEAFREIIEKWDRKIPLISGLTVSEALFERTSSAELTRSAVATPCIFALQLGLSRLH